MKILFATPLYPPDIGGPATYAKLLTEQLPKHGIDIHTICFSSVKKYPPGIRHLIFFLKMIRIVWRFDVVFAQDVFSVGLPAMLVALIARKPLFVRVPGDFAWEQARVQYGIADSIETFQTRQQYPLKIRLYRFVERRVVRAAHMVMTPSEYFARIVGGWGGMKPVVVYNGINLEVVRSGHTTNNRTENFSIISAGRMVPWKGFQGLIDTMVDHPQWRLTLVGDGPDRDFLKTYAQTCGVADRVSFLGTLPQEQLWSTIAAHDVFVLNSSFESFSYQVVEVMALGVPVVATEGSNLKEIITHEQEGLLVPAGDREALSGALSRIATDLVLRERLIKHAQEKSNMFSIQKTMTRLFELLQFVSKEKKLVLMGTDRSVFDPSSRTHARILSYTNLAPTVILIVPTLRRLNVQQCVSSTIMIVPTNNRYQFGYVWSLFWEVLFYANSKSIVSPQDPVFLGMIGYMAAKIRRSKYYVQLHTDIFSPWYKGGSLRSTIEQKCARFVLIHADKIRVVSERIARSIGSVSAPVSVIPIVQRINTSVSHPAERVGTPVFLMVARMEKEKHIEGVITVFARLFHIYKSGRLSIAGSGTLEASIRNHAARLGVSKAVVFEGAVDPFPLFARADVFVQNSYYEGFGLALVEALASGCPVISTRVGVAEELIQDGVNSFLFDVADTDRLYTLMEIAYRDPERLATIRTRLVGTTISSRYTDEKQYLQALKAFYE